jgi:hypothetical protein
MSSSKNRREITEQLRKAVSDKLNSVTDLDQAVRDTIIEVLDFMGKRPLQGLITLLKNHPGWTSGKEIKISYDHSPRVLADLKDYGIPILAESRATRDDSKSHHYRLGRKENILRQPLKGRSALRKAIKRELLTKFGNRDSFTQIEFPESSLQIDHRIPFRVSGDNPENLVVDRFMLLSASSQRAKAMACKRCRNMSEGVLGHCRSCYWASPEGYDHVELTKAKITIIVWNEEDEDLLSSLTLSSARNNKNTSDEIKAALRAAITHAEPAGDV